MHQGQPFIPESSYTDNVNYLTENAHPLRPLPDGGTGGPTAGVDRLLFCPLLFHDSRIMKQVLPVDKIGLSCFTNPFHNSLMVYGYARVSTDGQTVAAQVAELTAAGAVQVFRETASGAKTDRAQLRKALAALDEGDVLMVTRFDRLARSTRDLLNTLATVAERKAGFRSLADVWADTTTSHGRLMVTVLGGLAEFERDLIRARTTEGRARAVARGVKPGPKFKLTPHQKKEAAARKSAGEPVREIARSYNVSPETISRVAV